MSKFNYDALEKIYTAFKQSHYEHDETGLLQLSKQYGYADIDCLVQIYEQLEHNPEMSEMTLIAEGVSFAKQRELFGKFTRLQEVSGVIATSTKPARVNNFDVFILPYWKVMSNKGIVLKHSISPDCYTFANKESGVEITIRIRPKPFDQ